MVPAVVAAPWESSWHLLSGPTTAISIVVFASTSPLAEPGSPHFIGLVLTLTLLASLIQLAMGLARLGMLINFISHSVIIGFTSGAAILIAARQVKNLFGLDMPRGAHFHEALMRFGSHITDAQPRGLAVGAVTLASGSLAKRHLRKLPYMIVAMVVAAILNARFGAELLAKEAVRRRKLGGGLYLVGVQPGLCEMLRRSGQVDAIGEEQIFRHKGDALQAVYPRLDSAICRSCTARIFRECHGALRDGTPRVDVPLPSGTA